MLCDHLVALPQIVSRPHRLEIGVMEASSLLLGIFKVKGRTWDFVINVNLATHERLHRHAVSEERDEVRLQRLNIAPNQLHCSCGFHTVLNRSVDTRSQEQFHAISRIGVAASLLIYPLLSEKRRLIVVIVVSSLLRRTLKDRFSVISVVPIANLFRFIRIKSAPDAPFVRLFLQLCWRLWLRLARPLNTVWIACVIVSVTLTCTFYTVLSVAVRRLGTRAEHKQQPSLTALRTGLPARSARQPESSWHNHPSKCLASVLRHCAAWSPYSAVTRLFAPVSDHSSVPLT